MEYMEQTGMAPLRVGAIRSRIVAGLCGISMSRLQYWHRTLLTPAETRPGRRGVPRLFTWDEYMKVRTAVALTRAGDVSTQRVRQALEFLNEAIPDWSRRDLHLFGDQVLVDLRSELRVAEEGQQLAFREFVLDVLQRIQEEGPLGSLNHHGGCVDMKPTVLAGNPTIRGRRVQPSFIAELSQRGMSADEIAEQYFLSLEEVNGALAFHQDVISTPTAA